MRLSGTRQMYGVFKTHTRGLFRDDPARKVNKMVGCFRDEQFALALVTALHQEQMRKIGTVLDEYEIRPIADCGAGGAGWL